MRKANKDLIFTIIGTGKVGSALCFELKAVGYNVKFLIDKDLKKLKNVASKSGIKNISTEIKKIFLINSDVIIISVQDKHLPEIINDLKNININLQNKIIVHTSGYFDSSLFKILNINIARTGSFHPLQTFNRLSLSNNRLLRNIYFGIEGGIDAKKLMAIICKKLNSKYLIISKKEKPLYHFACVFASNLLVTYLKTLSQTASKLKIRPNKIIEVFYPIINETIENIRKHGFEKSLTGPFVRGDIEVIKGHIGTIKNDFPDTLTLYKLLGNKTMESSIVKNKLSATELRDIKKLLSD